MSESGLEILGGGTEPGSGGAANEVIGEGSVAGLDAQISQILETQVETWVSWADIPYETLNQIILAHNSGGILPFEEFIEWFKGQLQAQQHIDAENAADQAREDEIARNFAQARRLERDFPAISDLLADHLDYGFLGHKRLFGSPSLNLDALADTLVGMYRNTNRPEDAMLYIRRVFNNSGLNSSQVNELSGTIVDILTLTDIHQLSTSFAGRRLLSSLGLTVGASTLVSQQRIDAENAADQAREDEIAIRYLWALGKALLSQEGGVLPGSEDFINRYERGFWEKLISSFGQANPPSFDTNALGENLARYWDGTQSSINWIVSVLSSDKFDSMERSRISNSFSESLTDVQIRWLGSTPEGRNLLEQIIVYMQSSDAVALGLSSARPINRSSPQARRLIEVGFPEFTMLREEAWVDNPQVQQALLRHLDVAFQSINDRSGLIVYDRFSVTVTMPPNSTPQEFLDNVLQHGPNVIGGGWNFNNANEFIRRGTGPVEVGEYYDIDFVPGRIGGIITAPLDATEEVGVFSRIDGGVMLVDRQENYFIFQAAGDEGGELTEYGARMFGYIENADGTVTIYTTAVSRPSNISTEITGGDLRLQPQAWESWMNKIGENVENQGGAFHGTGSWTTVRID